MSVRDNDFFSWQGPRPEVTVGELSFRLPAFYYDSDVFESVHTASYNAVSAALPSKVIEPVRWVDGRAVVVVGAFRYHVAAMTAGDGSSVPLTPYGEILVGALVSLGPAPRALPLLRPQVRVFVLHLPVTTREANDGGRQWWGYPKFVADMDFTEHPGMRRVELSEGGSSILQLTVWPHGPVLVDRSPATTYTAKGGELLETVIPVLGHRQIRLGPGAGELLLGEHEVADSLRRLDVSASPLAVFSYLDHRAVLPAGQPVGPAADYVGYLGLDRDFGRFTVSYPGTGPIDQYATGPAQPRVAVTLP